MNAPTRPEKKTQDSSAKGTMNGYVMTDGKREPFVTEDAYFEPLSIMLQIYGVLDGGTAQQSSVLLQLKLGTPSGSYEFPNAAIIYLGYYPPYVEGPFDTVSGQVKFDINEEETAVTGILDFSVKNDQGSEKHIHIAFDINNRPT